LSILLEGCGSIPITHRDIWLFSAGLLFNGELEKAAGFIEKAIRLNPGKPPSWNGWLAVCYLLLGREQEAGP